MSIQSPDSVEVLSVGVDFHHDPLNVFYHLTQKGEIKSTILLESCEIGSKHAEKSILVLSSALKVECEGHDVFIEALSVNGEQALHTIKENFDFPFVAINEKTVQINFDVYQREMDEEQRLFSPSPIDILRNIQSYFGKKNSDPYACFLAGLFAYDLIETYEQLPLVEGGKEDTPNFVFYLAEKLLVIDHAKFSARVVGCVFSRAEGSACYFDMSREIAELKKQVEGTGCGFEFDEMKPTIDVSELDVHVDVDAKAYENIVTHMKKEIVKGEVFQIVPARTFSMPCAIPYQSYQQLKRLNPSPYMFFMNDERFQLFGASPESAVKYEAQTRLVEVYPIAGTRPRGKFRDGSLDVDADAKIEVELKLDEKELTEHIMLVDLARNDIAKISKPGTRSVPDLLNVDRYSHVMHLVSRVRGELKEELDALHAYRACMNMGTLVGAPKIRAAEILRKVEGKRRGAYGGAVGYLDARGNMDTCIVIRSALVTNQTAYIKAGAGIVLDSEPSAEVRETENKAMAVIKAILAAYEKEKQS